MQIHAQQPAINSNPVRPRIVASIDESKLVTFQGGVPLLARSEFDLGRTPASTQMTSVRLVLSRSAQQEAALDKFMGEQLDPSSPNYHHWLTPQQFGQLYGPADSDMATLVTWLETRGFTVQPVAPGHTSIAFSGSVSQIEAAFHTEIHSFNANGVEFLSNVSSPSIPAAIATVVTGIGQLNTIKPRPHYIPGNMGKYDSEQKRLVHAPGSSASGLSPLLTIGSGTSTDPYNLYVVPGDAATIYNSPNIFNAAFSSGTSYTGTGVTIGIGGDATIQGSTVAAYRNAFQGDTNQPIITNVASDPATCTDANSNTCDQDEAYLDNEIAGGLAPGATIHFYTSANLDLAIEQAINDNTVDIFSLSFGECEAGLTTSDNGLINSWWQQAATQGIAITVSSGDNGSAGCDNDNTQQTAIYGLQVSGFASTPYNIAVGGTDYSGLLGSFTTYVSLSNTSSPYFRTALGYIPESTWNDSSETDTTISANVPYVNPKTNKTNIVGGSGGASSCSTNTNAGSLSGCTSGYAKPSWQRGTGVPADSVRDLPDISLLAGNGFDDASWLVCTDDTGSNGSITVTTNCTTQADGNFYFYGFGGTSTSAPAFAGMLALVQQKTGSRLGQAAKNLYDLYNGSHSASVFHDITTGNISVLCASGTPNCSKNTAGNYFLTGYNTTTGYDLATGLGSVNVTNLINYWGSAIGSATATVSVTPSASPITTAQSLTVTGTVTGASGTPTGSVTLTSGSYTSSAATLDGSGKYSITVPAGSLKVGSNALKVSYTGDSTYAMATGTGSVTVNALTPTVTVTPASATLVSNQTLSVTVTVAGTGATPTGTVTLKAGSYTSSATTLSSGSATITIPANTFTTAGANTITVNYSGDSNYASASGTGSVTVTIFTPLTPTVTVTPGTSSIVSNQSLAVAVKVAGTGATPTGTVTLKAGSYTSSATTLSSGGASFTIPAGAFTTAGANTISVSYSGDSNYSAGSGSSTVTVTLFALLTPTVTVTPASTTVDTGQSLAVAVKVAGTGATPTGTVTLTAGSYTSSAATLSSGAATITIPANTLSVGSYTLSVAYSGDSTYATATGTSPLSVAASTFTLTGPSSQPTISSPGGTTTSSVTIASTNGYTGSVSLACALTSSPSGAVHAPTCTMPTSVSLTSSILSVTQEISFSSTAATAAPGHLASSGSGKSNWTKAGAASLLAVLVFFGIPARRRAWRAIVGVFLMIVAFGALSGCGGTSGSGGGGGGGGTTTGAYTYTVTATASGASQTATITLTVN